jgi:cell wall-associated NlpC family hydrolase
VRLRTTTTGILLAAACALTPVTAQAATAPAKGSSSQQAVVGGQAFGEPNLADTPTVPGTRARLLAGGRAAAPEQAPEAVKQAIWRANEIIGLPYRYGGGHRRFKDTGYDCSGTVSYALNGAGLLDTPLDSTSFLRWAEAGAGDWITVFTNPGHAYVVIAGLRLDTSAAGDPRGGKGPRWRVLKRSDRGFQRRHPAGL